MPIVEITQGAATGSQANAAVDPYLLALRTALKTTFQNSALILSVIPSDVAINAQIMPLFSAITTMFQQRIRKDVIRQSIAQIDPSWDDTGKVATLQSQLLSVPEWTTDTSDQ